ncbi:unnamed protein product [Cuscuta campestris]|uniref:DUF4283 domain-containing protein n=1 Tax=Cuscuta campestris TaxID=132261 RepID=A0A484N6P4_9ASTE|nr:unnamed protein product [Cuscuta campestris]
MKKPMKEIGSKPMEFIPLGSLPLKTSQRNPYSDGAEPTRNQGQPSIIPDHSNGDNSEKDDLVPIHPESLTNSVLQPEAELDQPVNPNQHNLQVGSQVLFTNVLSSFMEMIAAQELSKFLHMEIRFKYENEVLEFYKNGKKNKNKKGARKNSHNITNFVFDGTPVSVAKQRGTARPNSGQQLHCPLSDNGQPSTSADISVTLNSFDTISDEDNALSPTLIGEKQDCATSKGHESKTNSPLRTSSSTSANRDPDEGIPLKKVEVGEKVTIPEEGYPSLEEDWGYCLVGCFTGRFPGIKAIEDLISLWGVQCKLLPHARGWVLFQFPSDEDRRIVLQNGPYTLFGKTLLLRIPPEDFRFNFDAFMTVDVVLHALRLRKNGEFDGKFLRHKGKIPKKVFEGDKASTFNGHTPKRAGKRRAGKHTAAGTEAPGSATAVPNPVHQAPPANTSCSPTAVASPDGMDKLTKPTATPLAVGTAVPIEAKRRKKKITGDTPIAAGNGGLPFADPPTSVQVEEARNKALNMKAIDDQATTKTGDSGKEKVRRPAVETHNNKGDANAAPTTMPKDQARILGKHPSTVKP